MLFQHLFWFYSHPAVYIMVLPAMGVISDVIAAFARKNVFGYKMIAYSSLGIAFVGFFAWGHHMFVSGQSPLDTGAFGVDLDAGRRVHGHQGLQLGGHAVHAAPSR